jgi:hypothetical protein
VFVTKKINRNNILDVCTDIVKICNGGGVINTGVVSIPISINFGFSKFFRNGPVT